MLSAFSAHAGPRILPQILSVAVLLVMAPIAATFATDLGYRPEALLMATAVGAGCVSLRDYARLGAPLLLVLVVGTPLILWVWPVA